MSPAGGGGAGLHTQPPPPPHVCAPPTPIQRPRVAAGKAAGSEKEHKYTRILYYINTHARLYKYPALRQGVLHKYTHMTPQPSPLTGLPAGKGRREGANHPPCSVLATQTPAQAWTVPAPPPPPPSLP